MEKPDLWTMLRQLCCILVAVSMLCSCSEQSVILDTDISTDVDDVGAVAVLHHLADRGEARILGMMVSSGDPWSASCLSALNTFFGRPHIPIGVVKGKRAFDQSKYTESIAREFQHDSKLDQNAPDAVRLYREILSTQPDHSVVLISIGYLTNLHNLLLSTGEGTLPGPDLVRKKVKALICMGGQYPQGKEWNFSQDPESTRYVLEHWPTKIVFSGYELGVKIMSGRGLNSLRTDNLVRRSYELYNNLSDRPSWDQVTVLYGVRGIRGKLDALFAESPPGMNISSPDGANFWNGGSGKLQSYLQKKVPADQIGHVVEECMILSSKRIQNK
jgi:purine nucleosidase